MKNINIQGQFWNLRISRSKAHEISATSAIYAIGAFTIKRSRCPLIVSLDVLNPCGSICLDGATAIVAPKGRKRK